jgi:hypothetical protein
MKLHEAIAGTYAVIGQPLTDVQLAILTEDLEGFPLVDVLTALSKCRKELRKLALVDILDRLPNGHPGPEEAWAIVSQGMEDGGATIIWTDEMREAFGVANKLAEDHVGARMAFKEQYTRLVSEARSARAAPSWSVSLGTDKAHREMAILEGVKQGRLTQAYAQKLLPHDAISTEEAAKLLEQHVPKLLE